MLTALTDTKGSVQHMSRRRRQQDYERDHSYTVASPTAHSLFTPLIRPAVLPSPPLQQPLADRRRSHPDRHSAPPTTRGPNRLANTLTQKLNGRLRFEAPRNVLVCVRRKQRREVLHALRRTGKGSRSRRMTINSSISCK